MLLCGIGADVTFWSSKLRTGRKEYRCVSCFRAIPAGGKSYAEAGMFEGDFYHHRLCVPCKQFIDRLYANDVLIAGESFYFTELPEMAREAGEPWPPLPEPPEVQP